MNKEGKKKYLIFGSIAILIIIILFMGFLFKNKSHKKEKKDTEINKENISSITFEEDSQENTESAETSKPVIKEMDEEEAKIFRDNGNTHDVDIIDTSTLERYTTIGGPYENDIVYQNNSCGIETVVPKGYSTVEQANNILCIRDNTAKTQVAIIHVSGTFSDGITVWETACSDIYKITAYLTDETGVTEEKTVKNHGSNNKSDIIVGNYAVKEELGEIWFRNTGEPNNIKLPACAYYTTLPDNNGLILIGTSQTQSNEEIFALMDTILASITLSNKADFSYKMTQFESGDNCNVQFQYPENWELSRNLDGMVIIKAPATQSEPCNNMIIEFYADKQKKYVMDHAQFTGAYEKQLMAPIFLTETLEYQFETNATVNKLDMNAKIGEKSVYYSEITNIISCYDTKALNALPNKDGVVYSKRYSFDAAGTPCVINFIMPKNNTNCQNMMDSIMSSFSSN